MSLDWPFLASREYYILNPFFICVYINFRIFMYITQNIYTVIHYIYTVLYINSNIEIFRPYKHTCIKITMPKDPKIITLRVTPIYILHSVYIFCTFSVGIWWKWKGYVFLCNINVIPDDTHIFIDIPKCTKISRKLFCGSGNKDVFHFWHGRKTMYNIVHSSFSNIIKSI